MNSERRIKFALWLAAGCLVLLPPAMSFGQEDPAEQGAVQPQETEEQPSAPEKVDVQPTAADVDIAGRLKRILEATAWFDGPDVRVDEGVVFLAGRTRKAEYKDWAGTLARNTQDVVAVVNQIELIPPSIWDFSPVWGEIESVQRSAVQGAPLFLIAVVMLVLTWFAARLSVRIAGRLFQRRIPNRLLRQVATNGVAVPVFLLGLYLVLRVSGLSQMAVTVVGGTGLVGLVIGIAFRDIAENFLASILISIQRPFAIGDLIELEGERGFVQRVTARGTLLMTLDGNHIQIPNSTIYKAVIRNFTANPKIRLEFAVGIGYDDSVSVAQHTALQVLRDHPVVLDDPEPLVLVDELADATVNLHVYFWIDGHEHSIFKSRSSVIRLVKQAFAKEGISMPDAAREVVFPNGVPIATFDQVVADDGRAESPATRRTPAVIETSTDEEEVSNTAEGGLFSEAADIRQQAEQSRSPDEGANLLEDDTNGEIQDELDE